jgi:anti-anti-sigma factor
MDRRRAGPATVTGEIDIFTAPRLRDMLVEEIEAGHVHLLVDVEKITFLDSTALAVLIGAWWRVRAQGRLLAVAAWGTQGLIVEAVDVSS